MRKSAISRAGTLLAMAAIGGCTKPATDSSASSVPSRKAGLWEQTVTRDGKPGRLGVLKLCLDASSDAKIGVFGRHFAKGACERSVTRDANGVYHFTAECTLRDGAKVKTQGTAMGDFGSAYTVRSDVDVTGASFGPMNGDHEINVNGRYLGPCPADLKPGDVALGAGLKVNMDRIPQVLAAFGGN